MIFAPVAAWIFIHCLMITIDGLSDEILKSDAVVILGNKVNPDGTLSPRLEARMEAGLKLYEDQMVDKVVVSGGLGKEGHYEANKMRDYLVDNGVPEQDIIVDNAGDNTLASARNSKILSKEYHFQTIILVSQFYHISRAKVAFQDVGFIRVLGVHCDYFEARDAYSLFREFFAYYFYLLR